MIKWVSRIYNSVLLIIVCGLVILLGAIRIIGYTPYAITSGSMIPEYPVGSIVYVKCTPPEELSVGDDISFYIEDSVIATHRIGTIDYENNQVHTYGINNIDSEGNHINDANEISAKGYNIKWIFTVQEDSEETNTYKTGDDFNRLIYVTVIVIAMGIMLMVLKNKKRKA